MTDEALEHEVGVRAGTIKRLGDVVGLPIEGRGRSGIELEEEIDVEGEGFRGSGGALRM